ncbi:MAG TPA: EI24 domain-containing protein [Burkholderiales bacterium]|nr:EI24 domain-containing protein [Burkholderiales bacterium]
MSTEEQPGRSFDTLHSPPGKRIGVVVAFQRAMLSQLQPAMLALAMLPVVAFGVVWAFAFWFSWAYWLHGFETLLAWLPWVGQWFKTEPGQTGGWFIATVAGIIAFLVYVLLVLTTALTFVSTFGMPLMLRHAAKDYPELERRHGGTFTGSLSNALWGVFWFLILAAVSLPFWFVPIVGWLIPLFLLGMLNARILRYDALADHASVEEMQALSGSPRLYWRILGFGGALLNIVPVLWFFSTTLTGLAFIHYALAALAAHRTNSIEKARA